MDPQSSLWLHLQFAVHDRMDPDLTLSRNLQTSRRNDILYRLRSLRKTLLISQT